MRRRHAVILLAASIVAGCESHEPPIDPVTGRFPVNALAVTHDDTGDSVLVWLNVNGISTAEPMPIATRVRVLDDTDVRKEREVRIKIEEGPNATKIGKIDRSSLRPAPKD